MSRLRTVVLTLTLPALLLVAACNGGSSDDDAREEPPFPVNGMLTDVAASDAGELEGIALREDDGSEWTFAVLLDNPASVTADHLEEHIRLSQPVQVFFRGSGENRTAYRIDDAPP